MYEIEHTSIPGVEILTPKQFKDDRGVFFETYSERGLQEHGIDFTTKQENHILNKAKGVIRGLHFQNAPYAQAKIVRCIRGEVDDVAVDLRKGSPTYLQWVMVTLSAKNQKQLFLPQGFAHGVISRSEISEIQYVADNFFHPEVDRNIAYNDPVLGIDWKEENPVLSPKDQCAPLLKDSDCNFQY